MTLSEAESAFDQILRGKGFKTAAMKKQVKAPSLQGDSGYIILPDILAVDNQGRGWCFEVKDETWSKAPMRYIEMTHGYSGPAWFLEPYKAESYLEFSRAFSIPCVIAIRGDMDWKAGFLTRISRSDGGIDYNRDQIAPEWDDPDGIPILFSVLLSLDRFFRTLSKLRSTYWKD